MAELVLTQAAFWLVAAFVFGCLFAELPGRNGVVKALGLAAVFAVAWIVVGTLPVDPDVLPAWLWALEMGLYLVLIGVAMDWKTLHARNVYWRHLLDHYAAGRWQLAFGYVVPILVSAGLIVQQALAGNAADALTGEQQQTLTDLIRSLPSGTGPR